MFSGDGQAERTQEAVDVGNAAAGDDGQGAVQRSLQGRQHAHHPGRNLYAVRFGRKLDQGAVEIEEQRGIASDRGKRQHCGHHSRRTEAQP
jgi:hypothetical protein